MDVWSASRTDRTEPFSTPVVATPLIRNGADGHPAMCELTCEVFYTSTVMTPATVMRTRLFEP